MRGQYKVRKKPVVQLTSLLDLLFVMIFISLSQQKSTVETKTKVVTKTVTVIKAPKVETPSKPKKVVHSIKALFNFYATAGNPGIPEGTYRMSGIYNSETGELSLGGMEWVVQPKNYDMVPLKGKVESSQDFFTGRIQFQGCKQFSLRRESKGSGNPISGTWKGQYDCSQGVTGLTLTIE